MNIGVIGAGPSGLCAAKEIKEHNPLSTITVLEKSRALGGLFSSAYKGLTMVNNPLLVGFSDFLAEEAVDDLQMWSAEQYVSYLKRYAEANGITELIQYNSLVQSARLIEGKWQVNVLAPTGENVLEFDYLVLCCSANGQANLPSLPNQADFSGKIIHSSEVHDPADFANVNVVFLGLGETASDLSYCATAYARSTTVSVRRWPGYFIPRYHDGRPTDIDTSKIYHCLPKTIDSSRLSCLFKLKRKFELSAIRSETDKEIQAQIDRLNSHWPATRHLGPFRRITTKNCSFIRAVLNGSATLKPEIVELSANAVHFSDGTSVPADVIVCCTGYKQNHAFLPQEIRDQVLSPNALYRYIFLPGHEKHLAFIGYVRPAVGAVPVLAELQSRLLALFLNGGMTLPNKEAMHGSIIQQQACARHQFPVDFPRVGHIIDYYSYMHSLAKAIGVMPKQWPLLIFDPRLWFKINFSFLCPGMFRLYGPGAKPGHVKPIIKRLPTMPAIVLLIEAFTYLSCRVLSLLGFKRFKIIR
ncbi:flavin-containing monooxygenase [Pseudomonas sp. NPDC086251]|uniref:flavin-containing monooxygenase n=1 Tax=Pseudomonas sp. NPDC086251 TaxID=3364431 RepID=UPI003834FECA